MTATATIQSIQLCRTWVGSKLHLTCSDWNHQGTLCGREWTTLIPNDPPEGSTLVTPTAENLCKDCAHQFVSGWRFRALAALVDVTRSLTRRG